jgi:predicted KAP-like P-loop ATPase
MPSQPPFALSDEPISNSLGDRLNRRAFAKSLAHVICRLDRGKSTVLALTGPWGSGKTSIKNLLVEELEPAENQPRIFEFSPWQVSGTGYISARFFEAVLAEVSKEKTTGQESKDKIRKYASWLSRGSVGMAGLSTVLSVAGG